jgi:hypothetical protein
MVTLSKIERCLKTFKKLNFLHENDQPDFDRMRFHIWDCLNALLFIEATGAKTIADYKPKDFKYSNEEKAVEKIGVNWIHQVFLMATLMSLEYGGNFHEEVSKDISIKK